MGGASVREYVWNILEREQRETRRLGAGALKGEEKTTTQPRARVFLRGERQGTWMVSSRPQVVDSVKGLVQPSMLDLANAM